MKLPAMLAAVALLLAGATVARADKLEDTYQSLQAAVAKKDPAAVKKLAAEIAPLLDAALAAPAPVSDEERAVWQSQIDYAKGVGEYVEYAMFASAIGAPPATLIDMVSALEQRNPKSKYLNSAYGPYLAALNQTGAQAKIPAIADKAIENFPENADLLIVVTETAFSRKQSDRALVFANRMVGVLNRPKPEGISDADWARKRTVALGRGYFIAGALSAERNDYNSADRNLRAALPLIQGNQPMVAAALFNLGLANYQIGMLTLSKARVIEAARFSEQCQTLQSPYLEQARHNALVARRDAEKLR